MKKALLAVLLCAGWALQGVDLVHGQSQGYPNKPIKMIVPFPPGGPTDGMARIISDRLGAVLGQTVVVDNRSGAGGTIGARAVAAADPDGYTILITPGGALTTGPATQRNVGYDPAKAFVPVAQLIVSPHIFVVHPDVPAKTMAEVVAYAKANPGKLSWGSQGFGTAPHLMAELFKLEAGIDIVHVPYRGTAPMLAAILAGEVQIVADPSTTILTQVEAGKVRPLAVTGTSRFSKLPDVPTIREAGYPKLNSTFWLGVVAPAGTPDEIVNKLNAAFRDSLAPAETRARLENLGAQVKIDTPQAFGKMLAEELARWTEVVKAANLKVE